MTIDEAAQKIADAMNAACAAAYDIDWDRTDGGVWLTRGAGRRFESCHVREEAWRDTAPWVVSNG